MRFSKWVDAELSSSGDRGRTGARGGRRGEWGTGGYEDIWLVVGDFGLGDEPAIRCKC